MIEKLDIERLSHEGRGIGHHNDRTVFAMGALAHRQTTGHIAQVIFR